MKVCILQHVSFEGPAMILDWVKEKGFEYEIIKLFEGQALPALNSFELLVVMGGPMSVHDEAEFAWLKEEKVFIKSAIDLGKKVLGICLGAQLIANVLGAEVTKAENKEIGWFPVELNESFKQKPLLSEIDDKLNVLHWHGEGFSIPNGADLIFSSEGHQNQAFTYGGNVLALQFHFEMNENTLKDILENTGDIQDAKPEDKYIQSENEVLDGLRYRGICKKNLFRLLDTF
ncbi:MAG: type 1 glutamine amidotransferase [Candidatus Caenarcaniphilales bacterium]|nr:type 1 glutamine amidotransferase [Candidatus Caenarcaniphilales bacterium]